MVDILNQSYYRDIAAGDTGDDVAKAQKLLIALGYAISDEELEAKRYGESTAAAKKLLLEDIRNNPLKGLLALLQALLTGQSDALEDLLQVSAEDIEDELGPEGTRDSANYAGLGGNDGVLGTGRAVGIGRTLQYDTSALSALGNDLDGATAGERTASLASKFIGQHERGDNAGAIVQLVNGYSGDAWCGGFAHYVFSKTMPGVYDQDSFRSARSYMEEGKAHGAFHARASDYAPKVGDAIVFQRGGDPSKGHVGIVTGYDPQTKQLTYVSGNDGNAVRPRVIDMDNPPSRLLGFTDSEALARAKGVAITVHAAKAAPSAVAASNMGTNALAERVEKAKDGNKAHAATDPDAAHDANLFHPMKGIHLPSLPKFDVAHAGHEAKTAISHSVAAISTKIGGIFKA